MLKLKNNNTSLETANAFRLLIKSYDREAKKLTKEEAKRKLNRLDKSLTNLYDNYCLRVHAFKLLDNMIFDRLVKIDLR
tara:strand:+ start:45 stop:281 length:237 start_codon:yes stop_codon:yes gene_type:complete